MKKLALLLISSVIISSCYYDKMEELKPGSITNPCDATLAATYDASIQLIMNLNCVSCHDSKTRSGNVILATYDDVRTIATNGLLVNVIERKPGYQAMPPSQALSACQIEKIKTWIQNGTPK